MIRAAWQRLVRWPAVRSAKARLRMHLEVSEVIPDHGYPLLDQDMDTIREYRRGGR
jgi:hypothetical protein